MNRIVNVFLGQSCRVFVEPGGDKGDAETRAAGLHSSGTFREGMPRVVRPCQTDAPPRGIFQNAEIQIYFIPIAAAANDPVTRGG